MNSFVADFSTLPNPDEFDEDFGSGYSHYAANPALGASYASYIRDNAVLGYPLTDSEHAAIDTEENNRRISPHFMLASQHGTTRRYIHRIQNQMPGLCRAGCHYRRNLFRLAYAHASGNLPDRCLTKIRICEVKGILEGNYYWSSMLPVLLTSWTLALEKVVN